MIDEIQYRKWLENGAIMNNGDTSRAVLSGLFESIQQYQEYPSITSKGVLMMAMEFTAKYLEEGEQ